jgi:hypothetical protein
MEPILVWEFAASTASRTTVLVEHRRAGEVQAPEGLKTQKAAGVSPAITSLRDLVLNRPPPG